MLPGMPRLWNETIEVHRREVREAIVDTTAALIAEHGLLSVTMSQIAEATGIGRATLYKYFSDVEAILVAWHERRVRSHLQHLEALRDRPGEPDARLENVLEAYALISRESRGHTDAGVAALLHGDGRVAYAEQQLHEIVSDLIAAAAAAGQLRDDVSPDELAAYCLHAVEAGIGVDSAAAARRIVAVTMSGLRPPREVE